LSTICGCLGWASYILGVELDPRQVEVIVRRHEALKESAAILAETGETVQQPAVRRRDDASDDCPCVHKARTESTLNGARPGYACLIQWSMEISQVRHRLWPFKTPDTDRDEFVWLSIPSDRQLILMASNGARVEAATAKFRASHETIKRKVAKFGI
jgi:hypothetical protein